MIFSSLHHPESWSMLEQGVLNALHYAQSHDLSQLNPGRHDIDGDDLFVNIVEYETTAPENRFWEAHKDYLDVHVPLLGSEQIDLNFIRNMKLEDYQPEADFLPMNGEKNTSVIMNPSDFLVCYPADAHRTAVAAKGRSQKIKKAIFKVRIQ